MPEISDAQLQQYQRLAGLVGQLESDPRSAPHIAKAVKELYPDVKTPGEQLEPHLAPRIDPIEARLKALEEADAARAAAASAAEEAATTQSLESQFAALRGSGYTDAGIEQIKKIMVDKSIADPTAAALLFDHENPKPPVADNPGWVPNRWNTADDAKDPNMQELFANEESWADKQVGIVLAEERAAKAA